MLEKIIVDLEEKNRLFKKMEHRLHKANEEILRLRTLGCNASELGADPKNAQIVVAAVINLSTF